MIIKKKFFQTILVLLISRSPRIIDKVSLKAKFVLFSDSSKFNWVFENITGNLEVILDKDVRAVVVKPIFVDKDLKISIRIGSWLKIKLLK